MFFVSTGIHATLDSWHGWAMTTMLTFLPKKWIGCNKRGAESCCHLSALKPSCKQVHMPATQAQDISSKQTWSLFRPGSFQAWSKTAELFWLVVFVHFCGLGILTEATSGHVLPNGSSGSWVGIGHRCCDATLDNSGTAVHCRPFTIMHFQGNNIIAGQTVWGISKPGPPWLFHSLTYNSEATWTNDWKHTTSQEEYRLTAGSSIRLCLQ